MKILEAKNLDIRFLSRQSGKMIHAVDGISFSVREGEFLGLVGESGCGKSTVAKILSGLIRPDQGQIFLHGEELHYPYPRRVYQSLQMIFQLPQDSFNPRHTVGKSMIEMQSHLGVKREDARKFVGRYLNQAGLDESFQNKYPHQMSGGECQRAAIARALSVHPEFLICDEITSALDVSVQAQIIELLERLKKELKLSVLFISHDLGLVRGLCDRVLVMNSGKIIEEGETEQVLEHPKEEYTKLLIDSVLEVGKKWKD